MRIIPTTRLASITHPHHQQVYTLSKVLPSPLATFAVAILSLLPVVDVPTTLLLQAYLAQVGLCLSVVVGGWVWF